MSCCFENEPGAWLNANDQDFCRLDERSCNFTFFQLHLVHGIGGDDRGDVLAGDVERDLSKKPAGLYAYDSTNELIASADAAEVAAQLSRLFTLVGGAR